MTATVTYTLDNHTTELTNITDHRIHDSGALLAQTSDGRQITLGPEVAWVVEGDL